MAITAQPTATVQATLDVARRNVGFIEGPGENENPYAPFVGHAQGQPWCASFIAAVCKRAGLKIPSTSAYTPTMANGFKSINRWYAKGRPGDIVFFQWPSMGRIAHVGIVETVHPDGSYTCIEGNTDSAGGRTGGRVMRQRRRSNIAGFGRPWYYTGNRTLRRQEPAMKGEDVRTMQKKLVALGNPKLKVTGSYDQPTADVANIFKKNRGIVEPGWGPKCWDAIED